jgi:large subunit ribosomal protein L10
MPSQEKVEQVARLKGRISSSQALLLAEYRGLSVKDATELRRTLGDDARFSVVKNTERLLEGPTAVAFVAGHPVAAAKRVVEAAKRFPVLALKGAFMEGRVLDADEARGLAELESRDVMLSRLAGAFKAEMSRAAGMFQALQGRFLSLLEAYKEKVPPVEEAVPGHQAGQLAQNEAHVPAPQAEGPEPPQEAPASQEGEKGEE